MLVDSDRYLKQLVRYIHLNPVKAGLVDSPEEYQWGSHNAFLGDDGYTWLEIEPVLRRFGEERSTAIKLLREFVTAGIAIDEEVDFEAGCAEGVLGEDEFIAAVQALHQKQARAQCRPPVDHRSLVQGVADQYGVSEVDLRGPGRSHKLSHVRGILAVLVNETSELTLKELAEYSGRDISGLSRAAARLNFKARANLTLVEELGEARTIMVRVAECLESQK